MHTMDAHTHTHTRMLLWRDSLLSVVDFTDLGDSFFIFFFFFFLFLNYYDHSH